MRVSRKIRRGLGKPCAKGASDFLDFLVRFVSRQNERKRITLFKGKIYLLSKYSISRISYQ